MNELEAEVIAAARRWHHAKFRSADEAHASLDLADAMTALEAAEEREQREDRPRIGDAIGYHSAAPVYPSMLTRPKWELRGFDTEAEMRAFENRTDFPGWEAL